MADQVQKFIVASDNATDYADYLLDEIEQDALEDIDDLIRSAKWRDEDLWDWLDVSTGVVIGDYDDTPVEDRDLDWSMGLAELSTIATIQFFLENRDSTIIKPLAYRDQLMSGFILSKEELVTAGKRGFQIVGQADFVTLQNKFISRVDFLKDMSNSELYEALLERNAIRSLEKNVVDAMGYVSRMTEHPPGSRQFKDSVANLVSSDSKRALKGMNRRAIETLYTEAEVDGNPEQLMVWIVEGGKNTCSFCRERRGRIETYAEWLELGTPGAAVCAGGDY